MMDALVDSTVIIHLLRRHPTTTLWFKELTTPLALTSITWLEIIYGAPNKAEQLRAEQLMGRLKLLFLTHIDQLWAMDTLKQLRLSKGISINDCLIASIAMRLQIPIYTHNTKDFLRLLPETLVLRLD
ncbi:MAG: PIN domain-containing protein [Flavobacteriales bacterium]